MTAAIYRMGLPGIDPKQPVETFEFIHEKALKTRLNELAKGYTEGERVRFEFGTFRSKSGKDKKYIHAFTESDYSYIAYIGYRLKIN